jgi:predicted RNA-binding protein YlxR (DUF448 family)
LPSRQLPGENGLPAEHGPERTCIVTRKTGSRDSLIRFVVAPDGSVVPDIRAKLPGRGAWLLADKATVALGVKRKAFARAFKAEVKVAPDLPELVERLLQDDALQALSFANKAGLVASGSMKVEKALAEKPVIGLVHAIEAGHDGVRKIAAAARRRFGEDADKIHRLQIFAEEQLDLALGRTHVIHAALAAGAASEGFIARSLRLERFRGLAPLSAVGDQRSVAEIDRAEDKPDAGEGYRGPGPQDGIADE